MATTVSAFASSSVSTGSGSATTGSGSATTGSDSAGTGSGSATTGSDSAGTGSGSATTGSDSAGTGSGSATTGSDSAGTGSGSTSTEGVTTTQISITSVTVNGVAKGSITISAPTEIVKVEFNSSEKLISLLGSNYIAGATVEQLGAQDLIATGLTAEDFAAGVTITFSVSTVKAGDKILILHKRSSDNIWEVIQPTVVADGSVTAVFHSLSPVVFVEMTGGNVLPATNTTSPKTGSNDIVYYAGLVAFISFAGIICLKKKKSVLNLNYS